MIVDLPGTTTAAINRKLVDLRDGGGTIALGRVLTLVIVTGEHEAEMAIEAANRTEYGLVAYLYTRDLARAFGVCEAIETGMVGLNQGVVSNPAAPFGGVKQSGFGREGGEDGVREFLQVKNVYVELQAR